MGAIKQEFIVDVLISCFGVKVLFLDVQSGWGHPPFKTIYTIHSVMVGGTEQNL